MAADKVHGNEPLLQREFCILENRTRSAREVMLALIAAVTSVRTSYTVVFATVRAYNVIAPTNLGKRLLADVFVVEVVNHCDNRVEFAEIYHILYC
jgi:hypothetical protein